MKSGERRKEKNHKPGEIKGRKEYRNYSQSFSTILYPHEELKCPYCGSSMLLKKGTEIKTNFTEDTYFVCKNYPVCDCYCRVRITKSKKKVLISAPADKKLRMMRKETHHYLQAVIDLGLFAYDPEHEMTNVYLMLNEKTGLSVHNVAHIGECREYGCKKIASACIDILYANKDKIENYRPWINGQLLDEREKNLIKEIEQEINERRTKKTECQSICRKC